MEVLTGLFLVALYRATEKIWEKGLDTAWTPIDEGLRAHFYRWAGKDRESDRRAAFAKAVEAARDFTLRHARDAQQAKSILAALNSERNKKGADALAEEAGKLLLFSASPDVHRLTTLCRERLHWDAVWIGETAPTAETVAAILSDFIASLRETLLDQEPYHDLIQKDMRRALYEILTEMRPVGYDEEANYRSQLANMYRELDFVGIPRLKDHRPVTVEDIFVRLWAEQETDIAGSAKSNLVQRDIPEGAELSSLQEIWAQGWEQMPVDEALQKTNRLVILGDPGAGKTMTLKYLTVICAERRAQAELGLKTEDGGCILPIFVTLREFAAEIAIRKQDYNLLHYFYTHACEHLMLNLCGGFFEAAMEAGRCLVCLDGLDEIWEVGRRKMVCNAVKALIKRFPHNRYIVASRQVGYDEAPLDRRDFVHYVILPLTDGDIREFVRKWYGQRERDPTRGKGHAESLIATIEREPHIKTLARSPLLLTIIALVHRTEAELPHERVKLYEKCVTTLIETWEDAKCLTIAEKKRPFYCHRRQLLERLAYELHAHSGDPDQVQAVREGDLELLLTRFLMENRRLEMADDPAGAREEACAFIRLVRGRTGLLVERGEGMFGFPRLTFQEYLAARYIEKRFILRGVVAIWEAIKEHLHELHWQEVILLLLGSLNSYHDGPTLLVERIIEQGKGDKLEPVLHRHLYIAARALADRVDVTVDLRRRVVNDLSTIARNAPWWEWADAFASLLWLESDCYVAESILSLACDAQVDIWVRRAAVQTLGRLGCAEEKVLDSLLAIAHVLQAGDWLCHDAAWALGQLG